MRRIVYVSTADVYFSFNLICNFRCNLRALVYWQWRPLMLQGMA